jgi:hypothetical protein
VRVFRCGDRQPERRRWDDRGVNRHGGRLHSSDRNHGAGNRARGAFIALIETTGQVTEPGVYRRQACHAGFMTHL